MALAMSKLLLVQPNFATVIACTGAASDSGNQAFRTVTLGGDPREVCRKLKLHRDDNPGTGRIDDDSEEQYRRTPDKHIFDCHQEQSTAT
jgi:hypothetical protein